ncbi:MAG: discoidin domain-containing protein [Phycisphaerae bacterium]|nr:discoidin domain-containing protein [Phycisphaerae bacterium]
MKRLSSCFLIVVLAYQVQAAVPEPKGVWEFNAPDTSATIGASLELVGSVQEIAGVSARDGAVRIGQGSYFICRHGMAPNGDGAKVNEWTLLIDFSYPTSSLSDPPNGYNDLFQTNPTNADDSDWTINSSGAIGIGAVGYSSAEGYTTQANTWYRLIVTVDNGVRHDLYVDGVEIFKGNEQGIDGRFSLADSLLLFAAGNNQDGDDAPIDVSTIAIWDTSLSADDIQALGSAGDRFFQQKRASNPTPANGSDDVLMTTHLTWVPGDFSGTHNVYFGESLEDVNRATEPDASGDANSFDPGRLEFGRVYYWRVDEVNASPDKTVFTGAVWSFTAEPYSIQIPVDISHVTASSAGGNNTPAMTVNGSGLTGNTHSSDSEDMWLSIPGDMSPWLMYELDTAQKLDKILIWNSNTSSEGFIGWGLKDVSIETSVDGVDWTVVVESTQVNRAPGVPTYNEPQAIDLGLVHARYVRINILSNWGGLLQQYGVSEVQVYGLPVFARTPDPASGSMDVRPDAVATWRAGREAVSHTIYMDTDANAVADGSASSVSSNTNSLDMGLLDPQLGETYYWRVDEVNDAEVPSVWAGPVWSLSTVTALTVDDFESYGNRSPDRPFQTWHDGYGYSADDFFPEYGGNGTGAGVGHDIWSPSSPHYDGDIMETSNTMPGSSQAMPFYYTNTSGTSTTERTFVDAQDWTVGGAKTLSIAFNGRVGNTGTLFIVINDTKITYAGDGGNIGQGAWQGWNIDLTTVNTDLTSVTKIQLGVEGVAASGLILFDDIRLFPGAGELLTRGDPDNNGLVVHLPLDGNVDNVASDIATHLIDGVDGNHEYIDGIEGQALQFTGTDGQTDNDVVAIDIDYYDRGSVALWFKPTRLYNYNSILDNSVEANDWEMWVYGSGEFAGRIQSGSVRGFWMEAERWYHIAMTWSRNVDRPGVIDQWLYINGELIATNESEWVAPGSTVYLGGGHSGNDDCNGAFDDFRIYDRPLTIEEVAQLVSLGQ